MFPFLQSAFSSNIACIYTSARRGEGRVEDQPVCNSPVAMGGKVALECYSFFF